MTLADIKALCLEAYAGLVKPTTPATRAEAHSSLVAAAGLSHFDAESARISFDSLAQNKNQRAPLSGPQPPAA